MCPKTGLAGFGGLIIRSMPREHRLELKSLRSICSPPRFPLPVASHSGLSATRGRSATLEMLSAVNEELATNDEFGTYLRALIPVSS